jgi:hypothetical protein
MAKNTKRASGNQLRSPIAGKSDGVLGRKKAEPPTYPYAEPGLIDSTNVSPLTPRNTEQMALTLKK